VKQQPEESGNELPDRQEMAQTAQAEGFMTSLSGEESLKAQAGKQTEPG